MKRTLLFIGLIFIFYVPSFAQGNTQNQIDCFGSSKSIDEEILKRAFNNVIADKTLNKAGRSALLKLYKSGYSINKNFVNQTLKKLPDMLKFIEATESVVNGDYKAAAYISGTFAAEKALTSFGVPMVGHMIAAIEIVDMSYKELRHQTCLLENYNAYNNFLKDEDLQKKMNVWDSSKNTKRKDYNKNKKEVIDHYIAGYINGDGPDHSGNLTRSQNRERLQCFVDEILPGQNITVQRSTTFNPLNSINNALTGYSKEVRNATLIMLNHYHKKQRIENEQKKLQKLIRNKEFKELKSLLPILTSHPLTKWICDEYNKLNNNSDVPPVVKETLKKKGECSIVYKSGANDPEQYTIDVKEKNGSVSFMYQTYTAKDRIHINYGGSQIFDSGCVGTGGEKNVKFTLNGASSSFRIIVNPLCDPQDSDTEWYFKLGCPE